MRKRTNPAPPAPLSKKLQHLAGNASAATKRVARGVFPSQPHHILQLNWSGISCTCAYPWLALSPKTALFNKHRSTHMHAQCLVSSLVGVLIPYLTETLERLRLILEVYRKPAALSVWMVRCESSLEVWVFERVLHCAARPKEVAQVRQGDAAGALLQVVALRGGPECQWGLEGCPLGHRAVWPPPTEAVTLPLAYTTLEKGWKTCSSKCARRSFRLKTSLPPLPREVLP